jgi:hypothetical protein
MIAKSRGITEGIAYNERSARVLEAPAHPSPHRTAGGGFDMADSQRTSGVPQEQKCECGCGAVTPRAKQTSTKDRWTKGQPLRFIPGHNLRRNPTRGYKQLAKKRSGSSLAHVLIAEMALGKTLPPQADVHHVDENTLNNAPSNLVICQDRAYHKLLHIRALVVRAGGDPNTQKVCRRCRVVKSFSEFYSNKANKSHGLMSICSECANCLSKRHHHMKRSA